MNIVYTRYVKLVNSFYISIILGINFFVLSGGIFYNDREYLFFVWIDIFFMFINVLLFRLIIEIE